MSGAIALAGIAALRGGAGLVKLAVPETCQDTIAGFEPSYMTVAMPEHPTGHIAATARRRIESLLKQSTAADCGPGLGRSPGLNELVASLYQSASLPMVLDADGLNALAEQPDVLSKPGGPRVLTPHPGEFRRLAGEERYGSGSPQEQAARMAAACKVIVVLKGHRTLVTDGVTSWHNSTGNPGMATGGCGDVLTGLVTAMLCQSLSPLDAAKLAVHVHGLAGDLAAADLGQVALIASDLPKYLGAAFATLGM
jgi:NAD(P)H-hydrate epimerase